MYVFRNYANSSLPPSSERPKTTHILLTKVDHQKEWHSATKPLKKNKICEKKKRPGLVVVKKIAYLLRPRGQERKSQKKREQ